MELKNYWRLIMTNGQEYIVASENSNDKQVVDKIMHQGLLLNISGCITLQLTETSDPLYIKHDKLFSVQKVRDGAISPQTKLWRLI